MTPSLPRIDRFFLYSCPMSTILCPSPSSPQQSLTHARARLPSCRWPGYEKIKGQLLRAPILRAFSDARSPEETKRWASSVSEWPFERVISSHFASPIRATPAEFKAAFGAVFGDGSAPRLEEADWESLDGLNKLIEDNSLGSPLKASYR